MNEPSVEEIVARVEASLAIEGDHEKLVCLPIDTVVALIDSWRVRGQALASLVQSVDGLGGRR